MAFPEAGVINDNLYNNAKFRGLNWRAHEEEVQMIKIDGIKNKEIKEITDYM